jgi:hypothetical protein
LSPECVRGIGERRLIERESYGLLRLPLMIADQTHWARGKIARVQPAVRVRDTSTLLRIAILIARRVHRAL